jgi:putative membrane protein
VQHLESNHPIEPLMAACVAAVQSGTSASVAVVVHPVSGNYRDVAYLAGAATAWLVLLFLLVIPHEIHEYNLLIHLPLGFLAGAWLTSRTRLLRWLTPRGRLRRRVKQAAAAAFHDEGLRHAPHHQGLLVYWSRLEHQVEVLADAGVLRAVPPAAWHRLVFAFRHVPAEAQPEAAFQERLAELGHLLASHLPAGDPVSNHFPLRTGGGR